MKEDDGGGAEVWHGADPLLHGGNEAYKHGEKPGKDDLMKPMLDTRGKGLAEMYEKRRDKHCEE